MTRVTMPYILPTDAAGFFDYLAQRALDAPGALHNRLRRAQVTLIGAVVDVRLASHRPEPSIAESAEVEAVMTKAGEFELQVVEVAVERVLHGSVQGEPVVVSWIRPTVVSTASPPPHLPKGRTGILFLDQHPDTALGRELRTALPGSFAPQADLSPQLVADPTGEIAAAVEWSSQVETLTLEGRLERAAEALRSDSSPLAALARASLAAWGEASIPTLRAAMAGARPEVALVHRAILHRLGGSDPTPFDPLDCDDAEIEPLGISRVTDDSGLLTLLFGSPVETPIDGLTAT